MSEKKPSTKALRANGPKKRQEKRKERPEPTLIKTDAVRLALAAYLRNIYQPRPGPR